MKIFIWFILLLIYFFLTIFFIKIGVFLGFIPDICLFSAFCFCANYLCQIWDRYIIKEKMDSLFPYALITQKVATFFEIIQKHCPKKDISAKELIYFTAFNYLKTICKTEQEVIEQAIIAVNAAYNSCIDARSIKVNYDFAKIDTEYVMEALTNLSLQLEIYSLLYNDKPLSSNDIQAILRRRNDFYTIVNKTCKLRKHSALYSSLTAEAIAFPEVPDLDSKTIQDSVVTIEEDYTSNHPEQDLVSSTSPTNIEKTTDSTAKKKYMKKSTTLILCITITLVFSVAIGILLKYSKDARLDAAVSGYKIGYEEGYDKGSDEGYSSGYDDGYDEGYDKGEQDGYDKGYDKGFDYASKPRVANTVADRSAVERAVNRAIFNAEHLKPRFDTTKAATIVNEYINGGSPDNLKLAVQAIYEFYLYFIMEEY